ncbi:MAG TPA: flagellar motor switch protein FliN [Ignavibacteria bacterium]|nr:flagellar motor switch protein FliN [Ignavibacteria bacterium]
MEEKEPQENVTPDNGVSTETEIKDNGKDESQESIVTTSVAEFEEFDESKLKGVGATEKLEFLKDLQLNVYIELGRTQMQIKEVLELERGYVIEVDKLASEPVDIYVNNKKIAEGEVVVIDKHFGIRITNLNEVNSRLKGL